jgi:hypothetical protein
MQKMCLCALKSTLSFPISLLKGTFSRKSVWDYPFKWYIRSKLRYANPSLIFKNRLSHRFFKRGVSRCKKWSTDLPEPAAIRQQNSYTHRSSVPYQSSVMLRYAKRISTKLHAASMFYSIPLSLSYDANLACIK